LGMALARAVTPVQRSSTLWFGVSNHIMPVGSFSMLPVPDMSRGKSPVK
jgi:hypothetical protein